MKKPKQLGFKVFLRLCVAKELFRYVMSKTKPFEHYNLIFMITAAGFWFFLFVFFISDVNHRLPGKTVLIMKAVI